MKKLLSLLFVCLLVVGLVGCSSSESASTSEKYHVGVIQLVQHEALDKATQGFVDVLYEEFGEDGIEIDVQNAAGDSPTCAVIANGFAADGVDLIMANATPALQAAVQATAEIPVLGTSVTEYSVALDLDNFNGTVGGNVSGTSDLAPLEEQAQMIIDLAPEAKTVGIIYCSAEANSAYQVKVVEEYLSTKGIKVEKYPFADSNDIQLVAQSAVESSDAIYIPTDNSAAANGDKIGEETAKKGIPVICGEISTCEPCGGVATLTIDYYELGRTTGQMAVKILKGEANISEMPIEYYANPVKKYDKAIAEKLGIVIPEGYVEIEG